MDDLARSQFNEEKREERAETEVSHLQEIASPYISSMITEKGRPLLPAWVRQTNLPQILLNGPFTHPNFQLEQLTTNAPHPEDAVYVLASPRLYHLPRRDVQEMLTTLVHLPQFQVQNRWSVLRALDLYAVTKLDFGDALIIASMEQQGSHLLYSYDTDFDHFQGITRREP